MLISAAALQASNCIGASGFVSVANSLHFNMFITSFDLVSFEFVMTHVCCTNFKLTHVSVVVS